MQKTGTAQGSSPSSEGIVQVSWYRRNGDADNRYYHVEAAQSYNSAVSWTHARVVDGALSDPEDLPKHCKHPGQRFIGDYAGGWGGLLHAHLLYTTVPGTNGDTQVGTAFRSMGSWFE